jgi:hypothetical protein
MISGLQKFSPSHSKHKALKKAKERQQQRDKQTTKARGRNDERKERL